MTQNRNLRPFQGQGVHLGPHGPETVSKTGNGDRNRHPCAAPSPSTSPESGVNVTASRTTCSGQAESKGASASFTFRAMTLLRRAVAPRLTAGRGGHRVHENVRAGRQRHRAAAAAEQRDSESMVARLSHLPPTTGQRPTRTQSCSTPPPR